LVYIIYPSNILPGQQNIIINAPRKDVKQNLSYVTYIDNVELIIN